MQVLLSPTAALLMDFHAHLNTNEVVGLLGGEWDEDASVMRCACLLYADLINSMP